MAARYVDNLLTIHKKSDEETLPSQLLQRNFYGSSVDLDFELDLAYLGMTILPRKHNFQIGLAVPGYEEIESCHDETAVLRYSLWRYRTTRSAGSRRGLFAGFESRLHNAARLAFPPTRGREAIAKLLTIAILTGQDQMLVKQAVTKHSKKYPAIYGTWLGTHCQRAMMLEKHACISQLRRAVAKARQA